MPPGTWLQKYTSYGTVQGTFPGTFQLSFGASELPQFNGVIYNESSTTIAQIIDGTSNTLAFGEHAITLMSRFGDSKFFNSDGGWNQYHWFDTMISAYYPPNVWANNSNVGQYAGAFQGQASSLHPGGCNFAFADGSVRFIKNTIGSWAFSPTNTVTFSSNTISAPVGVTYTNFIFSAAPTTQLGVYQKLATRAGGEVESADSF